MNDNATRHKAGERIAKVIARAGLGSRRDAEAWIAAGRVAVNGSVIDSPALNVTARDRVTVDGAPLPERQRTRLFLYHKPRGLITTEADPQGRPTIFHRLPRGLPRLISIGRLDFNTEGLLLLTNDGALARVLELPATGWLRRYRVRAHGTVTQAQLNALRDGVTISGIHYGAIDAAVDRVQGSNLWLTFSIREGKNREVRNVLGHLGLTVTRLIRISFGPFQLGELAEGAVEEVRTRTLREQLGARLAALAGLDFSAPTAISSPARLDRDRAGSTTAAQKTAGHSWRAPDSGRPHKLQRRKFHGGRHDADQSPAPAGQPRADTLTDRKGRRVAVERHGEPPPAPTSVPREAERRPSRHRPRRASDRGKGARPSQPRPPGGPHQPRAPRGRR